MASESFSRDTIFDLNAEEKKHPGRFSRSQTFEFIRAYRQYECLWNVGIPEYNDKV